MAIRTSLNDTFRFPVMKTESDLKLAMNNGGYDQFLLNLQNESQQLQNGNENQRFMFGNQSQYQSFGNFQNGQKQDVDRFIMSQNQRLRFLLQEQRKQQMETIRRIEEKASYLLAQKDQEIMKSLNRKTELEITLQKKVMENQTWQRLAKQRESMVAFLNSRLQEEREKARLTVAVEDEGSCCGGDGGGESRKTAPCKGCGSRDSCVLMLPCKHLCCCRDCEAFLDSCPVCCSVKTGSIEVLIT